MENKYYKYKGLHPGAIIERELSLRNLKQRPFALSLMEHPQTFNNIIKGQRDLPVGMALKIEKEFGMDEGTLVMLQGFYAIQKEKSRYSQVRQPDMSRLRKNIFWDTNVKAIDWDRQAKAVIKRIFERGNFGEKRYISQFYGLSKVRKVIESTPQ